MMWHIVKKDWKLMWPYATGVAAMHFAVMLGLLRVGRFGGVELPTLIDGRAILNVGQTRTLALMNTLPLLSTLALAFLVVAIVQQDAIPGVRQDWLVRPIRRRDLLFAKIVGVWLMVIGPIFAADFCGALLNGFPLKQSFAAALSPCLRLSFSLVPAVFALASVTRNLMEAVVAGTAIAGVFNVIGLWRVNLSGDFYALLIHRSVDWIDQVIRFTLLLIGVAVLVGLQYSLRKTFLARVLIACAVPVFLLIPPVPWQTAFALEQWLSSSPAAANSIRVSFAPNLTPLEDRPMGPSNHEGRSAAIIPLPVRVIGVPDNAVLNADNSTVRLIPPQGQTQTSKYQMGFTIWKEQRDEGEKPINYVLRVPRSIYARIADQYIRVEVDYDISLLRLADSQILPAIGGDQRTRILGSCGTKVSQAGGEILLGCIQAAPQPSCASVVLEYKPTGVRNHRFAICRPDYSPFRRRFDPDGLTRFTETLPFGNPAGDDTYPIKEPMLPESQVEMRIYQATDHFVRQLVIPSIRLSDWAASGE